MALSWDEMLSELRALGGTAENLCLRQGPYGRGLFAIDPAKPVRLRVPDNLLLDLRHLGFVDGEFRVAPDAPVGERERRFHEAYQRDFSWGTGHAEAEELLKLIHAAPPGLRALLDTPFNAYLWLVEPTPHAVQQRYLGTRVIRYKDRWTVMPVVELANHGHTTPYEVGDGVGLSGVFEDEILAEYQVCDPWNMFAKWGFAGAEPVAMSLAMGIQDKVGEIVIERAAVDLAPDKVPFFPEVKTEGGKLVLSYMMLGHKKYPRLARGIFRRIMRDAGRPDADETFDRIQHVNRTQFLKLAAVSEDADPALGRLLRSVVRLQLEAMSCSIGAREV
ncbi:MAG: hypothetical protein JOZ72_08240 [Alphaproteobacteria bacterium]|nr:hypothetical protein [Alphaproteobacteria bacterium]